MKYLLYAITLIVVAIVMYHATYFFFWLLCLLLPNIGILAYCIILAFVCFGLFGKLIDALETRYVSWVIVIFVGWFIGAVYALVPSIVMGGMGMSYYDGLIIRCTDFTSVFEGDPRGGLVDKWGRTVIDNGENNFVYINQKMIIGLDIKQYVNQRDYYLNLYEGFVLKKTIVIKADINKEKGNELNSVNNYIYNRFGIPMNVYSYNDDYKELQKWYVQDTHEVERRKEKSEDKVDSSEKKMAKDKNNKVTDKVDSSEKQSSNDNNGYTDLGSIECNIEGITENRIGGLITTFHLYVRNVDGDKYYYACDNYGERKYCPITRGSWTKEGEHFNARFHKGSFYYYLNISSWYDDDDDYDDDHVRNEPTKRDPVPVQEWVPCPACGNSPWVGLCPHCAGKGEDPYYFSGYRPCPHCGGNRKCTTCGGQGGHYETRFR